MGSETLLILFLLGVVVAGPVLAIVALAYARGIALRIGREPGTDRVEARLAGLENRLARLEAVGPAREAPQSEAPPQPAPTPRPPTPPRTTAREAPVPASTIDLEALIGGRWLNRIGIVALLLAVAFFLKFAFENDWVGPSGRVALGLVAGAALLGYSERLLRRDHAYFSEGIAALGAGVLYLSLYAAWGFYQLVTQAPAFAGMTIVTAGIVAIALGRDSERLALLALVGGLLTPRLLSTGQDQQVVLFTYLALLVAGLLAIAHRRSWRLLEPVALVGTVIYFTAWYATFYAPPALARTIGFATLLFAELATSAVLRARRGDGLWPEQVGAVLVNAGWYVIALHAMLWREHRWALTFAVLGLAALHVLAARLVPIGAPRSRAPARVIYAGLALTLLTIAVPIRLEGEWIAMAWAVEGAVLVWSGLRHENRWLRMAGPALFVFSLCVLVTDMPRAGRLVLNARFATFAVLISAYATAFFLARRERDRLSAHELRGFGAIGVAANVLAVCALSLEVWDHVARAAGGLDPALARQLGLSLTWTVFACGLIVCGVYFASAALRWQGLVLIGIVVVKVFLFDLSFLERVYRILSFFALGLVLLIVSFLYQRRAAGAEGPRS